MARSRPFPLIFASEKSKLVREREVGMVYSSVEEKNDRLKRRETEKQREIKNRLITVGIVLIAVLSIILGVAFSWPW